MRSRQNTASAPSALSSAQAREFRNLANLGETASTSRVLNLAYIHTAFRHLSDYRGAPFFKHPLLNKSIILKHTLRAQELDEFNRPRRTATKVILPFDPEDLRIGGSSVFVDQRGFETFCTQFLGTNSPNDHPDVQLLRLLDRLPSLDPFLVRELINRNGFRPAACYLKISPADIAEMLDFTRDEIQQLVYVAFGNSDSGASNKLATKILSNETDHELDPLKHTLRLNSEEFADGIFSWRGFLYYKWRKQSLELELRNVIKGLATFTPLGPMDPTIRDYLNGVRPRLGKRIIEALTAVDRILVHYDSAYNALAQGHNGSQFRRFLLDGPSMFFQLGESVAILSHISSFWGYRMGGAQRPGLRLTPDEYADILADFDESLSALGNANATLV